MDVIRRAREIQWRKRTRRPCLPYIKSCLPSAKSAPVYLQPSRLLWFSITSLERQLALNPPGT